MTPKVFPCWKRRYATEAAAKAEAGRLARRGLHQPERGALVAYQCGRCGGDFHIGHAAVRQEVG